MTTVFSSRSKKGAGMALSVGLVAIGLVLLIAGGEALLRGAVALASLLRLTPAIIGLTIVAAGTSMPELAVSISAATQNQSAVAVGNVVGSNISNIALILGLCAVVRPLSIGGSTIKLEYPVLVLVTLMCVALCEDGKVSRLDALLLLATYVGFTAYLISLVRDKMTLRELTEFKEEVAELAVNQQQRPRSATAAALVVAGMVLLAGGAHITVLGAVDVGRYFRLSEAVIGLTIVAVGTSLPEIVTSLVSSYRGRDDIAINNVIGSNLFNMLCILGFSGSVAPLQVPDEIVAYDNWWMLGVTVGLFPILYTGRRIHRLEGAALLAVYATYLTILLMRD